MIANIISPSITELKKLQVDIPGLKIIEATRLREGIDILVRHDATRFPEFLKQANAVIAKKALNLKIIVST